MLFERKERKVIAIDVTLASERGGKDKSLYS